MKVTALFIACIAISAYAGHLENIFEDVGMTEFGKTMITSIDLQLKSGEQVDAVIANVNLVSGQLKGQLASAEALYDEQNAQCAADTIELSGGLSQAMVDVEKFHALMEMESATLSSRVEELSTKHVSLDARKAMLNVLHTQREAEKERFEAAMAEYGTVFNLIDDVKVIIETKLKSGDAAEFLESKTSMQAGIISLVENFHVEDNGGVAHKHFSFFKVMASIMVKSMEDEVHADQEIVDELLSICDRIQENLSIAESTERMAEATRVVDYDFLADKVNKQIAYVMSQLEELNRVINTLTSKLENLEDNAQHSVDTAANFSKRLDDRTEECNVVQSVWENFYNNISAELLTCGKLTYLVEDKRALLARYGL